MRRRAFRLGFLRIEPCWVWRAAALACFAIAAPYLVVAWLGLAMAGGPAWLIFAVGFAGVGWLAAGACLLERSLWRRM